MTGEERALQKFYAKLLTLCNRERALSEGLFYDLMPANYDNFEFDSTKQFAFLRGTGDELILAVVNFDNKEVDVVVNIPPTLWISSGFLTTGVLTLFRCVG